MIVKVTCAGCVKRFTTSIPEEVMKQYHEGIPVDIAFYNEHENAKNLVVHKLCPDCYREEQENND